MPKAAKKPAAPVAPEPVAPPPAPVAAVAPAVDEDGNPLSILYDKLEITEYSTTSAKGPLTPEDWEGLLGWETGEQYIARKLKQKPGTTREQWLQDPTKPNDIFGEVYHCRDVAGNKIRCMYNAQNRPFDEEWCGSLIHTILYGQWAGPHTVPGETVNGETVRISKYGRVLSGQHQGTACILADQFLQRDREQLGREVADAKYPAWAKHEHCFLETIVITGMSEDPRILMTVDYVKPRTAADVFYTSEVFRTSQPPERKELCRMLASAVDLLWTRTEARGYRTHPEVVGFLERHRRLLEFVSHIFKENKAADGRKISKLRLQAGQCAAIAFLMGCSATSSDDSDVYRNESPPTEKSLDWSLDDRAKDFWSYLAGSRDFMPVRMALGRLLDSSAAGGDDNNVGQGGRLPEKLAILARAWEAYRDHPNSGGPPFTEADLAADGLLSLSYTDIDDKGKQLPDGQIKLVDVADFMGIDCPQVSTPSRAGNTAPPDPPAPSREDIEAATREALARRTAGAK